MIVYISKEEHDQFGVPALFTEQCSLAMFCI